MERAQHVFANYQNNQPSAIQQQPQQQQQQQQQQQHHRTNPNPHSLNLTRFPQQPQPQTTHHQQQQQQIQQQQQLQQQQATAMPQPVGINSQQQPVQQSATQQQQPPPLPPPTQQQQQQQNQYSPSGEILAMIKQNQHSQFGNLPANLGLLPPTNGAAGLAGIGVGMPPPSQHELSAGASGVAPLGLGAGSGFDMSDFPSLGQHANPAGGMQYFQQFRSQPHMPASEFAMQSEDFPALPAAAPGGAQLGGGAPIGASPGAQLGGGGMPLPLGGVGARGGADGGLSALMGVAGPEGALGGRSMPPPQRGDEFGLMGIVDVIRMMEPDINTLALGRDLTSLGLDMNSSASLYSTFSSPWHDTPAARNPEFTLPQCYYMVSQTPKTGHFSKFHLETLFYIFYNMPRDTLQAYAATELYNRDWRYHKDLALWFTRAPRQGEGDQAAKEHYVYFDINEWRTSIFHRANGVAQVGADAGDIGSLGS